MLYLQQSTASQEISLGVFVDETDGFTAETGLTIANTDIKIRKNGATTLANKNSGGATHISGGIYYATLDATDTDTPGHIEIFVHVSGARPVIVQAEVLPSKTYNAFIVEGLNNSSISGSSAIATTATSRTLTTGTETGTYSNLAQRDGTYHQVDDAAGALDIYYEFSVGGNGKAVDATFYGYLNSSNDSLSVQAYNWGTTSWDTVSTLVGKNAATDDELIWTLLAAHTGTGANLGLVRLRFYAASGLTSASMYADSLYIGYTVVSQSVGYSQGRVWINTVGGTAGTENYVNGVADNPSLTLADAQTIAASLSLHDYNISSDSTLAPSGDLNNVNIYGVGYTCTLGGHDYAGTHIYHASPVDGIATSVNNSDHLDILDSIVNDVTVDDSHFTNCSFTGTVTFGGVASNIRVIGCRGVIAGSGIPSFDFGTSAGIDHNLIIADWQNEIEIKNFNANVTTADLCTLSGVGQLTINASCTGGTINLFGQWEIIDNAGGAVTINQDDVATDVAAILADTNELQTDDVPGLIAALNDLSAGDILTTQLAESYAADGVAPTLSQALFLIQQTLGDFSISGTTLTVKKLDGTTTAGTFTLDSATVPTSITRTT